MNFSVIGVVANCLKVKLEFCEKDIGRLVVKW